MAQLAQMTVVVNAMQAQLKTRASSPKNQTRSKRNYYCCICGSTYTHGSKTWSSKKPWHQEEAYHKKLLSVRKKGCKWRLGEIINKIKIRNPKINLINCIGAQPNSPSNNTLSIADSSTSIHPAKQVTTTMAPVIISNEITERLTYEITMDAHI